MGATATRLLDPESRLAHDDHDALRLWLRLFTATTMVQRTVDSALKKEFGSSLPRFDLLAQSYGGFGAVVDSSAQFGPTLEEALAFTRARRLPAVIELRTDAQVITPGTTLAAIRTDALSNR
jgi:thiamine pyrophosphate-dependent acetolactate synthase large subunit-like protein